MSVKKLERNFLQRLFGISATKKPSDTGCWRVSGKRIELDLSKCPELTVTGGSVRLDGGGLETSVLVVQDAEGGTMLLKMCVLTENGHSIPCRERLPCSVAASGLRHSITTGNFSRVR